MPSRSLAALTNVRLRIPRKARNDYGVTAFALRCAASEGSEVTPREFPTRSALEILLECKRLSNVREGYRRLNPPWTVFRCMIASSTVVVS